MNDFAQNLFDFLALVGGFMVLLLLCSVVAKYVYLRRIRLAAPTEPDGEIVVPRYVISNGTDAMKRASEVIKVQNALINELETQHRRGHLIFSCKCDDCTRLAEVMDARFAESFHGFITPEKKQ